MAAPTGFLVYVGTYTQSMPHVQARAEGIYVYHLDPATGALTHRHTCPGVVNPSFLALHPTRPFLYAVNEVTELDGQPGGGVSAFALDPATGTLTFLNRQPSHGTAPCHLTTDHSGRFVLVANYGSGSLAVFPIQDDGSLGPATAVVQHQGASVHPVRQQGPHAHAIILDPANRFALAADLGLDQVLVYRFDADHGRLEPNDPPGLAFPPGSGPRHLEFHPTGRYLYVINELNSTLSVCHYDPERGRLHLFQTVSTLPADWSGRNSCADVHVTPDGRFVYGSNRGHDSLAALRIDPATGQVSPLGHTSTQGRTPRHFGIDPTGTFLLAANQDSGTVVTFRIEAETGQLQPTGQVTPIPTPVCLKFRPLPATG